MTALVIVCGLAWVAVLIAGVICTRREMRPCLDCGASLADHEYATWQGCPDPCKDAAR